jgi:hypothetical protein
MFLKARTMRRPLKWKRLRRGLLVLRLRGPVLL